MRVQRVLGCELKLFVVVDIAYRWVPFYCKISFVVGHTFERERARERFRFESEYT